ncbi:hypothetical protein [Streptomyces althioticus]|uniref:hypothetical protein n=1 Tax=Streptomyces althioticus TaxID=83380 RepID=UPI00367A0936
MSDPAWRLATTADRQLFEGFTCTQAAPRSAFRRTRPVPHPRPWELDVQKWFHEKAPGRAAPNRSDDARVWIAVSAGRIAAAVAHSLPDLEYDNWLRKQLGDYPGPIRLLLAVAVSLEWRNRASGLADAACSLAFQDAVARSGGESTLMIGRIDLRNRASERMARRNCFEPLTEGPDEFDPEMRQWYVMADPPD